MTRPVVALPSRGDSKGGESTQSADHCADSHSPGCGCGCTRSVQQPPLVDHGRREVVSIGVRFHNSMGLDQQHAGTAPTRATSDRPQSRSVGAPLRIHNVKVGCGVGSGSVTRRGRCDGPPRSPATPQPPEPPRDSCGDCSKNRIRACPNHGWLLQIGLGRIRCHIRCRRPPHHVGGLP